MIEDDKKKLAAYLFNLLNGNSVTIPAREAEVMGNAKMFLREFAEGQTGPQLVEDKEAESD